MIRDKTIDFLLTYDRSRLRLVDIERYEDGEKAVDLYEGRERQYADQPLMEVVLLGADSEESIRFTHLTYFRDFETEPFSMEEFGCCLPWLTAENAAI